MLNQLVNIPRSLQPKGVAAKATTVTQSKQIKKYGSLSNYERAQKCAATNKAIQNEIKSLGLDNVKSEAEYIAKYNSASTEAKKYLESPAELKVRLTEEGYYVAQSKYAAEAKAYQNAAIQKAEWAQAEKMAGKIQLGQGGRWDRRSSDKP